MFKLAQPEKDDHSDWLNGLLIGRARIPRHLSNHFAEGGRLENQIQVRFMGNKA